MSTALYRRYRPDTFADVVGQDHVIHLLTNALRSGKITHAYLFSGPRGCGKTTSARIMARCLNCAQGPTDKPCGKCDSCRELATGGSGSLDVVEIDAASHNGVDDARELRERATFAPIRDRYKIFILDEAHMVTAQGFNALLKLVEEPPEHVKFIFATTEPEKVIGTIRSRTHHYPFRLVSPDIIISYCQEICRKEGVSADENVLSLVARAGAGSVRDSLSVLDQLIAGSSKGQLDYDSCVALLGYTDISLLNDIIDALGAKDAPATFRVIERMVDSGHDPRRFVEDLLQRLRDLVIVSLAGNDARLALKGVPEDSMKKMLSQERDWGSKRLTQAASLTNKALNDMQGATSSRLQVELLVARLLLEGEKHSHSPAPEHVSSVSTVNREPSRGKSSQDESSVNEPSRQSPHQLSRQSQGKVSQTELPQNRQSFSYSSSSSHASSSDPADVVRQRWRDILSMLQKQSRALWVRVCHVKIGSLSNGVLQLIAPQPGIAQALSQGNYLKEIARAVDDITHIKCQVNIILENATRPEVPSRSYPSPPPSTPQEYASSSSQESKKALLSSAGMAQHQASRDEEAQEYFRSLINKKNESEAVSQPQSFSSSVEEPSAVGSVSTQRVKQALPMSSSSVPRADIDSSHNSRVSSMTRQPSSVSSSSVIQKNEDHDSDHDSDHDKDDDGSDDISPDDPVVDTTEVERASSLAGIGRIQEILGASIVEEVAYEDSQRQDSQ